MTRFWDFIRNNFLTKKFLTFGIIGVLNTLIHLLVYNSIYNENIDKFISGAFFSNAVAFIVASVFSYFANAYFTFKPKNKSTMQFLIVILVFLSRLLISSSLAELFDYIVINLIGIDYSVYPIAKSIAPFFASALLIPIAYFALDMVFKKTDISK
ncbi:MAG: GtrA family protein [Candidatus Izemoplasmatales bacterium]|nr:GtrA family protein [Candidatus Izemoplasmatales bacterium]